MAAENGTEVDDLAAKVLAPEATEDLQDQRAAKRLKLEEPAAETATNGNAQVPSADASKADGAGSEVEAKPQDERVKGVAPIKKE